MGEQHRVVRMYVCVFPNIKDWRIYESVESASIHLLLHFSSWPHVTSSRALSRSRSTGRIGRISLASRRAASHLPFGRISRPSALQRGFNVHAKQTAAPARLSIIRYIRLCLSNSSLTTPQTWLGSERGGSWGRKDKRCVSRPCAKEHRKFTGPRRSRDDVRPGLKTKKRREMETREESFRESYLVFQHIPTTSKDLSSLCISEEGRFDCE